ncbi:MAG: hypothetical protein WD512_03120 [Candidatus Paceibacterota bacterium]
MIESNKVQIEFTIRESQILLKALSTFSPSKDDEMIAFMIHARITRKIIEAQNEQK